MLRHAHTDNCSLHHKGLEVSPQRLSWFGLSLFIIKLELSRVGGKKNLVREDGVSFACTDSLFCFNFIHGFRCGNPVRAVVSKSLLGGLSLGGRRVEINKLKKRFLIRKFTNS